MKMWKVFVDGVMKRTLMEPNRLMVLNLKKWSDVDVICDVSNDLQSFIAKKDGLYQLSLNKERVFTMTLSKDEG